MEGGYMPTPIKNLECFVFDMDGTINLGNTLIPGALELIEELRTRDIKFFFFTNNSSKSPAEYVKKARKAWVFGDDAFAYHDIRRCDDPLSQNAFSKTEGLFIGHACPGGTVSPGGHHLADAKCPGSRCCCNRVRYLLLL